MYGARGEMDRVWAAGSQQCSAVANECHGQTMAVVVIMQGKSKAEQGKARQRQDLSPSSSLFPSLPPTSSLATVSLSC